MHCTTQRGFSNRTVLNLFLFRCSSVSRSEFRQIPYHLNEVFVTSYSTKSKNKCAQSNELIVPLTLWIRVSQVIQPHDLRILSQKVVVTVATRY